MSIRLMLAGPGQHAFPIWVKIALTAYISYLVPVYWQYYGPRNFLWLSDVALLVAIAALWLESSLLASMMAVGTLIPELVWNIGFLGRLIAGRQLSGLTAYMFDGGIPRLIRILSLFHVFLPVLLVWLVYRLGYNPRALPAEAAFGSLVFFLTRVLTGPEKNINWVYGPGYTQKVVPSWLYLAGLMVIFAGVVYIPTHFILKHFFPPSR